MKLIQSNGYRIPFPNPIEAETVQDINQENLITMRFSKDWLRYVLPALGILARPETYYGTKGDIEFAIQQGHTLLGLWEDGTDCTDLIPNWQLGMLSNADYHTHTQIPIHSSVVKETYYAFASVVYDTGVDNNDIYIYGFDSHGNAGGKIDIFISVDVSGRVYTLDTWDCLGNHVSTSGVTVGTNLVLSYTDMKIVQIIFNNTTLVFGTVKITDDAVCSNA